MLSESARCRGSYLSTFRHLVIGATTIVARGVALAMLMTPVFRANLYASEPSGAPSKPSVFQKTLESNYQNIFEATIIAGAQAPDGGSMPLDRLLALASRDGLQRLDDGSIFNLIYLRSELAERTDVVTCAGIWSGQIAGTLVPAIESLPADQQREWAQLLNQLALATINKVPVRPAPTPDQYQKALNRMRAAMPVRDRDAVDSAVTDSAHSTPAQECEAMRAFYNGLLRTRHADAVTVARGLLYQ